MRRIRVNIPRPAGVLALCLLTLSIAIANRGAAATDSRDAEFFEARIRPVLDQRCYSCHAERSNMRQGGLRVDSLGALMIGGASGPAIAPGQPGESRLLKALRYEGPKMPPDAQLPPAVIADFTQWIERGAPWPGENTPSPGAGAVPPRRPGVPHWAFLPVREPKPPRVKDRRWSRTPADRFVLAALEQHRLRPNGDADPRTLIRRASFDLTGLPPTPEEVETFVKECEAERQGSGRQPVQNPRRRRGAATVSDTRVRDSGAPLPHGRGSVSGAQPPTAYDRLVDRLLASPHFGERWGRHWLDLARYAESNGRDRNVAYPYAWHYRDYVIDAFNRDKPYDRFIREQIAGDLLPADTPEARDEQRIATGLLVLGPKAFEELKAERFRMDVIDDQIDVTSRAVLGLTVSCARCHDHKFDPIPTKDYYALAGIFGSTDTLYGSGPEGNTNGFDRPLVPVGKDGERLDGPWQAHRKAVAEQTAARNTARSDRYRIVRQKAAFETERDKFRAAGKAAEADALTQKIPPLDAEIAVWDAKIKELDAALSRTIASPPPAPDYAMTVREAAKPADCAIRVRGEYDRPGDVVPRGGLTLGSPATALPISPQESGRRQLAEWLTRPENPLTARVAVNRIWQHLFGRGLVATVDNFGVNGERPSHPELLDYLAARFVAEGWSVKRLVRQLMLSRAYRLSSAHQPAAYAADPDNRYLWRMSPRRLDAEAFRDAVLAVSGTLRERAPGSPVARLGKPELNDLVRLPEAEREPDVRTVYLPIVREQLPEILKAFDFPDPSLVIGRRDERTMPSQGLFLLNSPFMIRKAEAAARRLLEEAPDDAGRVDRAFQLFYGRPASAGERARALQFVQRVAVPVQPASTAEKAGVPPRVAAWAGLCQALFAGAEFRYLE